MSVVGYDGGAFVVEHIETPWNALAITDEACESFADGFPRDMDGPSRSDGCHGIFDLEGDSAASCHWHFRQRDAHRVRALHRNDMVIFNEQHTLTLCPMCGDDGVVCIKTKEDHFASAVGCHTRNEGVCGVEHGRS